MTDEILAAYIAAEAHLEVLANTARRGLEALRALNADPSDRAALDALEQASALVEADAASARRAIDVFTPVAERMQKPIEF